MLTALWFTILPRAFASALTTRASRTRQLPHAAAPARPWRVRPSASPRGITQLRAHGVHRRGSTGYPPRTGVLTPGCFRQARLCAAGTLCGLQVAATRHFTLRAVRTRGRYFAADSGVLTPGCFRQAAVRHFTLRAVRTRGRCVAADSGVLTSGSFRQAAVRHLTLRGPAHRVPSRDRVCAATVACPNG